MSTERRAVARYQAKLAVQINMNDYSYDVTSMEVSLQGLRILCEGPTANNIFRRYIQVTPGENIIVDIQIKIHKQHDLTDTLKCQARVISASRISQSSYIVGFHIIEFEGDGRANWQDYISTKH